MRYKDWDYIDKPPKPPKKDYSFAAERSVLRTAILREVVPIEYVPADDGHQCPTTRHTKRAQRLATPLGEFDVEAKRQRRTDEVYMKTKKLCRTCGYPRDNSLPHPMVDASGLRW
jgi:hypothetical protein